MISKNPEICSELYIFYLICVSISHVWRSVHQSPPDGSQLIRRRHCQAFDAKAVQSCGTFTTFTTFRSENGVELFAALKLPDRSACAVPVLLMTLVLKLCFQTLHNSTCYILLCVRGVQEPPKQFWRAESQRAWRRQRHPTADILRL